MRKISLLALSICFYVQANSQATTWGVQFSNAILSRYTPTINAMTNKGWEYSNSIILSGMEQIYKYTGTASYFNYIKAYIDSYIDSSGNLLPAAALAPTLDKIHPGWLCLFLYERTGVVKYKTAATNIRNYLLTSGNFKTTPDGGYWHKDDGSYNNIMMLDGIYMAHPFLVKYGTMFGDQIAIDTAVDQTLLLASHVYDNTKKLVKHAWDYTKKSAWANPVTGASSEVWSRGLGWYVSALVDILQYLPPSNPKYTQLTTLLTELAVGIKNNQDPTTGLWYQVVNKQDSASNYLESSGSGLIIYALKTAVNNGWIDTSYSSVALKGWQGLKTEIATYTDGKPEIKSFAPAMGVQNNYTAYVSSPYRPVNCPVVSGTQNPHGYCGLLLAASVMEYPITTYTFNGNGAWSTAANWSNSSIPPAMLTVGDEIIVDPVVGGQCVLSSAETIPNGTVINVKSGKDFVVKGNLVISR